MWRLYSFCALLGAFIGTYLTYSDVTRARIIEVPNYDFIKRNEKIESNGETYEVFWPALDRLENLKIDGE